MSKQKQKKRKLSDEERLAIRETIIRRLDNASMRQLIIAYFQSQGDNIANAPADLSKSLLYLLYDYIIAHGTTDQGVTGETDQETYEQAMDLLKDLSLLLQCKEKLSKSPKEYDLIFFVIPTLTELEEKWSKKKQIPIEELREKPSKLEMLMVEEILKLAPTLIAHLSTVASLGVKGGQPFFIPPEALPRFRRADIDGAKRE